MVSPIIALMKQARAYGVGCVLATQNPMDLDYRALGNAGLWCLGRLTTDADRERLVEALGGVRGAQHDALDNVLRDLAPRWRVHRRPTCVSLLDRALSAARQPIRGPGDPAGLRRSAVRLRR